MAAGTWTFYKRAKRLLGRGVLEFQDFDFYVALFDKSFSVSYDDANWTGSTFGSLSHELAAARGYTAGGNIVAAKGFTLSGTNMKLSGTGVSWSANAGVLGSGNPSIQFAVLYLSLSGGTKTALAFVTLSTSPFTVPSGSKLTINSGGAKYFEVQ